MTGKTVITRLAIAVAVILTIGLMFQPMNSPFGRLMAQSGTGCNNNAGGGNRPVLFWVSGQLFGCPSDTNLWTVVANSSGPVSAYGASGSTGASGGQIYSQPKIWAGTVRLGAVGATSTVTFSTDNAPTSATSYYVTASDVTSASVHRVCCVVAGSFGLVGGTGSSGDYINYHAVGN